MNILKLTHQKTFRTTLIALFAIILNITATITARAELKPKFDKLDLYNTISTQPVIEVAAEDKEWVKVTTQTLKVSTSYYVSLKKGKLMSIIALYDLYPLSKVRHTDGKWRKGTFGFEITNAQMGVLKNSAVTACNNLKKNGARTDETHNTYMPLPFKLFVRAKRVGNQATKTVPGKISAKIVCKKAPKLVEISHLDVKYDKDTNKCPIQGVVQVGFRTNRNDKIHFTLGHMSRGLHQKEYTVQPFMIDGQYVATKRIDLTIDSNTEYVSVKLKDGSSSKRWIATGNRRIECPPLKILSVWMNHKVLKPGYCPGKFDRTITITTNAPGHVRYKVKGVTASSPHAGEASGGRTRLEGNQYVYRSNSSATYNKPIDVELMAEIENHNANSGWMKLKADCVGTEKITMAFLDFKSPQCPRGAQAIAKIEADAPGPIAYKLDCASELKSWNFEGVAEAKASGGKFIAGLGHRLDINKSQHINCALKRQTINGPKLIALKGNKFQCVKKNPDIGDGPGSYKPETPVSHSDDDNDKPIKDPGHRQPTCKTILKKHCKTTPVKKCKKVVLKDCKTVPKTTCKVNKKKVCKRVPKRVCKKFRGKMVCKTKWKTKCNVVKDKVCKTTTKKKCTRKVVNKCGISLKKTCTKTPIKICRR